VSVENQNILFRTCTTVAGRDEPSHASYAGGQLANKEVSEEGLLVGTICEPVDRTDQVSNTGGLGLELKPKRL